MPECQAFADESFHEVDGAGFYVLAAAMMPAARHTEIRAMLLGLRGNRRTGKLHWNEMDAAQRLDAAKRVADIDELHVVTVGTPVPSRRQERARARCLHRLVTELHSAGITRLVAEARTRELDLRDIRTVQGARWELPKEAVFRIEHRRGADEPLLWSADIVAGAVRSRLDGNHAQWAPLEPCVYEIDVPTGC